MLIILGFISMICETNAYTNTIHPKKYIALTFDDGPDEKTTPLLLDILKAKNSHATFFMIGKNIQQLSGIVKRVYDEWNTIGNHTRDHISIKWLSSQKIIYQIQKTQKMIKKITWYTPILFRPPYGAQNGKTLNILRISHLPSIQRSLDSNDWKLPSSKVVVQEIMDKVHPWSIILMHDTLSWTIEAMPQIIDALQNSGYTLITVDKLLWGSKYIHPGKIYRKSAY